MCIFIDRYNRDLLKDTNRVGIKSTSDHIGRLVFLFSSFNKPFEFLLYKTNRLHFLPCVTPTVTPLDFVSCSTFWTFTRCNVICDLLQYTHMEKCNLFVTWIAETLFSLPISQLQYLAHSIQAI